MFCPNCGKDCVDAKFCPECGTQIQAVKKDTVWQVGMACPHCGGTKLDGNNCAFCGAQLIADVVSAEPAEEDSYEIPYGWYRGITDRIEFAKDVLVVHVSRLFTRDKIVRIQYRQITEATYQRKAKEYGHLIFHWNENGNAQTISISFTTRYDNIGSEEMFHLFAAIKFLSPETAKFSMDIPDHGGCNADFDFYFNTYSPYRRRAINALKNEYALTIEDASTMINTEFEMRQMKLYEENPILAIRDMNRVAVERQHLYDQRAEERRRYGAYRS